MIGVTFVVRSPHLLTVSQRFDKQHNGTGYFSCGGACSAEIREGVIKFASAIGVGVKGAGSRCGVFLLSRSAARRAGRGKGLGRTKFRPQGGRATFNLWL